jgi:hypothetical protein
LLNFKLGLTSIDGDYCRNLFLTTPIELAKTELQKTVYNSVTSNKVKQHLDETTDITDDCFKEKKIIIPQLIEKTE